MVKLLIPILRFFFRKPDPDVEKMIVILQTKLIMDNRRVNMSWKSANQKSRTGQLTRVLIIYTIFGFLMGLVVLFANQFLTVMVILHSYILFMMAMTLVTDFSSVLLDTTDNQIILTKPVSSKTLFLARTFHIFIYLLQFTAAFSLGSWIFSFISFGWVTGLALILTTFLTVLLAVFFTYFLYLAMLRFSSEQKIREVITWFQIFMTVLFSLSYQLLPRLLNFSDFRETVVLNWYAYLLPPVWMSVALEAVHLAIADNIHLLMVFLSVFIPVAGFWVLIKYLAPGFSAKLMALQQNNQELKQPGEITRQKKSFAEKLAPLFNFSAKEKAAFILSWLVTSRDRNFRMQFYPALGYIVVLFFVFMLRGNESLADNLKSLPDSSRYLWFIYAPVFLTSTAYSLVAFNEHFQASWIFHSTPLHQPGQMITGVMKSILVKYFLPVYLVLYSVCLWIWGTDISFDFLFGVFNNLFCFFVIVMFAEHYLPFSRQPAPKQQAGRLAKSILQFAVIVVLVGYHYLLIGRPWILAAIIPLLAGGVYLMYRSLYKIAWNKISV